VIRHVLPRVGEGNRGAIHPWVFQPCFGPELCFCRCSPAACWRCWSCPTVRTSSWPRPTAQASAAAATGAARRGAAAEAGPLLRAHDQCSSSSFARASGAMVCALINILDLRRPAALDALGERGLQERIDIAVQHGPGVGALGAGAE